MELKKNPISIRGRHWTTPGSAEGEREVVEEALGNQPRQYPKTTPIQNHEKRSGRDFRRNLPKPGRHKKVA
jgi:hypothetical protein